MKVSGLLGRGDLGGDVSEVVVLKAVRTNKILPPGYELDHDPDVGTLRRLDGTVVAYFPMWSFEPSAALQAAKKDLASTLLPRGSVARALRSQSRGPSRSMREPGKNVP